MDCIKQASLPLAPRWVWPVGGSIREPWQGLGHFLSKPPPAGSIVAAFFPFSHSRSSCSIL